MTGMYQCRDTVYLGRLILGTRDPRKFVLGDIVSGRPISPTKLSNAADETIEDMREEKVIMDFPEAAEKIIAANSQVKLFLGIK